MFSLQLVILVFLQVVEQEDTLETTDPASTVGGMLQFVKSTLFQLATHHAQDVKVVVQSFSEEQKLQFQTVLRQLVALNASPVASQAADANSNTPKIQLRTFGS